MGGRGRNEKQRQRKLEGMGTKDGKEVAGVYREMEAGEIDWSEIREMEK